MPPPGLSPAALQEWKQRHAMRRGGRDAGETGAIGPVDEIKLRDEARKQADLSKLKNK